MSDHADTIRRALERSPSHYVCDEDGWRLTSEPALSALDALVAENQQRTKERDVALNLVEQHYEEGRRLVAENQRLRDALAESVPIIERSVSARVNRYPLWRLKEDRATLAKARAALDGTQG